MYLIGVAIYLACIFCVLIFKHVPFSLFVNPSAIVLQLGAIFGVLTATNSFGVFVSGFKAAVRPKSDVPDEVRGRAASLFRLLSKSCALVMLLMLVLALTVALYYLRDIDILGVAIASAFVSAILGLTLIAVIFEPAVFILKQRHEPDKRSKEK